MIRLRSHAKVNLYLNVLRKRADGFHELVTLFERISLFDDLSFKTRRNGFRLKVSGNRIPAGPDNLIWKAYDAVKSRGGVEKYAEITVRKRIPVAAGLGGGSSNAAATILGLNRLWKLRLNRASLMKMAASLGSDVPFFITQAQRALGTGRGERIKTLRPGRKKWMVLVTPPIRVLTADIYKSLRPSDLTHVKHDARLKPNSYPAYNTLQKAVLRSHKRIQNILKELIRAGGEEPLVSGSGPSVFAKAENSRQAQKIAIRYKKKFPRHFVQAVHSV